MDRSGRRTYRRLHGGEGLVFFTVRERESDLSIGANRPLAQQALGVLRSGRREIEDEIARCPSFLTALAPLPYTPGCAPPVVDAMYRASAACGVGPMAAVAGALACHVGRALAAHSPDVVVENGGDVYIQAASRNVYVAGLPAVAARGASRAAREWGVCTSAGRVGHSLSLGCAHAAVILSRDAALSDAAATALGNRIRAQGSGARGRVGALTAHREQPRYSTTGSPRQIELVPVSTQRSDHGGGYEEGHTRLSDVGRVMRADRSAVCGRKRGRRGSGSWRVSSRCSLHKASWCARCTGWCCPPVGPRYCAAGRKRCSYRARAVSGLGRAGVADLTRGQWSLMPSWTLIFGFFLLATGYVLIIQALQADATRPSTTASSPGPRRQGRLRHTAPSDRAERDPPGAEPSAFAVLGGRVHTRRTADDTAHSLCVPRG